jgi:hypothetical protein
VTAKGRTANGQFAEGNPGGPGNPHAKQLAEYREAALAAVSPEDLREIIAALVCKAKAGDCVAAREVLDRIFGKGGKPLPPYDMLEEFWG